MPENAMQGFSSKKDKTAVNYRVERCGTCDYYRAGSCIQVEGGIAPEAVCNLWQLRSSNPGGMDAGFYREEYKKAGK